MSNTLYLPELREMLAEQDSEQLREFCTALHPARTAEFMEGLTAEESWAVLQHAEEPSLVEIFSFIEVAKQAEIVESIDREEAGDLIAQLASDDRVDILNSLPPETVSQLLPLLPADERRDILRLQAYPEGTAGAIMTTDFAKISESISVQDALHEIAHQSEELETIYYIYVVDEENHLQGLVSARQLVSSMGKPQTIIRDLMERGLVTVKHDDDQEHVAAEVARFDLLAIPVVDDERHMLGIITHDDVIDVVREEAIADAHRIAGVEPLGDDYLNTALFTLAWKRGFWLTLMFIAALLTALTLNSFHSTIEKVVWLVMFIPLVISSGGNSGNQSATLVITALNSQHLKISDWWAVVRREVAIGLLLGGFLAVIGYALALLVHQDPYDVVVIPLTLILVVISGTLVGAILPLGFARLGLDPALMSNPCVAGIMDILGILIYFTVAIYLLRIPLPSLP